VFTGPLLIAFTVFAILIIYLVRWLTWLVGTIFLGFFSWVLGLLGLIGATIYVYYNAKKFGIGGSRAALTLLLAIVGLPLYAYDLHKLRKAQQTGQLRESVEPTTLATTPSVAQQASATSPPTKFCRNCGAKIARDSTYCEECGTRLG
jgi:ribosomal protein L40E